jgi:hypothetical protein
MRNRYFTIGIVLGLLAAGLGRAEAKSRHFIGHFGGSAVDAVIDTNADGHTGSLTTGITNTNLGRFVFQGESESLPPGARVTCPAGTAEISLVQAHSVLTKEKTGEQLFLTFTSGTQCFDPTTGTFTFHGQGAFTGGTGRFINAAGTFEEDETGGILVLDAQGHFLANDTGTNTGTITGVGKEED